MLLQTNSYIVPREKREEHARLVRKFKQTLHRLGCDDFEIYQQVGSNWSTSEATGRYVQIMRFRDRRHQQQVQAAEREDRGAQVVIREFCELINFPYQLQQGLFASGFYQSVLPSSEPRRPEAFKGKVAPVMPATPAPAAPGEPMESPAAEEEQLMARDGDRQAEGAAEGGAVDAEAVEGSAVEGSAVDESPLEEEVLEGGAAAGEALEGEAVEFDIDIDDETADDAIVDDVLPPDDQAADGDATDADRSESGERSRSR